MRNSTLNSTGNPLTHKPSPLTPRNKILLASALCAVFALAMAGCKIQVDKGDNGQDKKVQVETPFGGMRVNTDQTTASDTGLPAYPGAEITRDKDNDKSADVHLGFGEWQLRVKAVNYASPDSQDKIAAFYKKALASYGSVISCRGKKPIGAPTVTEQGLTCAGDDSDKSKVKVDDSDFGEGKDGLELKAGSEHHQHIVVFNDSKDGQTRFGLVELKLPSSSDTAGKSN